MSTGRLPFLLHREAPILGLACFIVFAPLAFAATPPGIIQSGYLVAVEGKRSDLDAAQRSFTDTTPLFDLSIEGSDPQTRDPQLRRWLLVGKSDPESDETHWDEVHAALDGRAQPNRLTSVIAACRSAHLPVADVEPNVIIADPSYARLRELLRKQQANCGVATIICASPSPRWASASVGWHLGDDYSQLAKAAAAANGGAGVIIAHLDTGYDPAFEPANLQPLPSHNFVEAGTDAHDRLAPVAFTDPGHGPFTMGLLAGPRLTIPGPGAPSFDAPLGGAPAATVVPFRVTTSVVYVWPWRLAAAIEQAADAGSSVISIAFGSTPSAILRDAVNDVYDRGCVLVAAAGDYGHEAVPGNESAFRMAWPARFRRTIAVVGITEDRKAYASEPGALSWLGSDRLSWSHRGAAGPDSAMQHAIAAWTPNITAYVAGGATPRATLAASGTAAAEPQVAAAAALWLSMHREDVRRADVPAWEKAEWVRDALFTSARPEKKDAPALYGRGSLRANDALSIGAHDVTKETPAALDLGWIATLIDQTCTRSSDGTDADRLHWNALQTELAQLIGASAALQQIVYPRSKVEWDCPDHEALLSLAHAVIRDGRASRFLKASLQCTLDSMHSARARSSIAGPCKQSK